MPDFPANVRVPATDIGPTIRIGDVKS
jgi:hypothetical protein